MNITLYYYVHVFIKLVSTIVTFCENSFTTIHFRQWHAPMTICTYPYLWLCQMIFVCSLSLNSQGYNNYRCYRTITFIITVLRYGNGNSSQRPKKNCCSVKHWFPLYVGCIILLTWQIMRSKYVLMNKQALARCHLGVVIWVPVLQQLQRLFSWF